MTNDYDARDAIIEECAKVCDLANAMQLERGAWLHVAAAIRARKNGAPQGQVVEGQASPWQPAVAPNLTRTSIVEWAAEWVAEENRNRFARALAEELDRYFLAAHPALSTHAARDPEVQVGTFNGGKMNKLTYTIVEGKYQGVGRQYCPSAWLHEEGHGPDLSQTELSGPDSNLRVIGEFSLTALDCIVPKAEAAERRAQEIARIEAIVKAANAYPKLVEALHSTLASLDQMASIGRIPQNNQGAREARAILSELGEAE